jgi:cytochrome c-type protein NapB
MKVTAVLIATAMVLAAAGMAQAANPIDDKDMGLSKGSVFDVPVPPAWDYAPTQGPMPRYFPDAPPMVPHAIGAYENITASSNLCIGCHKQPDKIGQKVAAGAPTPMPASHYTDLRNSPGEVGKEVDGSRYKCTLCHQAQADAKPLVENTFKRP